MEDELTVLQNTLADQVVKMKVAAGTAGSYMVQPSYPLRWVAVKLLENDREIINKVNSWPGSDKIMAAVKKAGIASEKSYRMIPSWL